MIGRIVFLAAFCAATAALSLELPGNARITAERLARKGSYLVPVGAFDGQTIPSVRMEGAVKRQGWQVPGSGLTPLQILEPIRAGLIEDGYTVALDCTAQACGGFDFRFGIEILPAPSVYVNLRNYHFLSLYQGDAAAPEAAVTVLVSTTQDAAYVQIVEARANGDLAISLTPQGRVEPAIAAEPAQASDPVSPANLLTSGYMVLDGVAFATGATELENNDIAILQDLAAFLAGNPGLRIALVGHTDSVGSLDGNIRISKARAQSVRQQLIEAYGIAPARIEAEGMGYLAPRASNLTDDGRELNRRVEAIVLSNE